MDLVNIQTGKPEQSGDPADFVSKLQAGTHMPAGGRALVSPTGDLQVVPYAELQTALTKGGYSVLTPDKAADFLKQAKYGEGAGNELKAGLEGAARGATFGASDVLEPSLGISTPEAMRERRARNPASALTGELAGAVGSAVAAPELSPVGLAGKGAGLISGALEAGAIPEGASLATQVLSHAQDIGAKALGSAVEGAMFGGGEDVTEAALGDPDLTSDRLIANVGYGALMGGALGAGVGVLGKVVPPSVGKARDAVQGAWRKLFGGEIPSPEPVLKDASLVPSPETQPQVMQATGTDGAPAQAPTTPEMTPDETAGTPPPAPGGEAPPSPDAQVPPPVTTPSPAPNAGSGLPSPMSLGYEDGIIPKVIAKAKEALGGPSADETLESFRSRGQPQGEVLNPKERAGFVRDTVSALQGSHDAAEEALSAARPARASETTQMLEGASLAPAAETSAQIGQRLAQAVQQMEERPALYPARFAAKLGDIAADFNTEAFKAETAADHFKAIDNLKRMLDDRIPWNKEITGEAADAVSLLKTVRGEVRASLENEGVWGQAAARQASVNRATSDYLASRKEFQKRFMSKTVQKGKAAYTVEPRKVNEFFNMINDPRGEIRASAMAEHLRAQHALVEELAKTHEAAPLKGFDPEAARSGLSANEAQIERAKNVVSAQPGQGYGFFTSLFLGHTLGGPLATVATVAKHLTDAGTLATVEKAAGKTTNKVGMAAKSLFRPIGEQAAKASKILRDQLTPAEKVDRYKKQVEEIRKLSVDPEAMIDRLHQATKDGFDAAPKTMASLQQGLLRGTMFLASKIPPDQAQLPFDRKPEPRPDQVAQFGRYFDAVHDPLRILDELKSGRLLPETQEAVSAVYPKLDQEIKTELLSEVTSRMAKGDRSLPYQTKLTLSRYLGSPLDSSMAPQQMAAVQQAMQGPTAGQMAEGASMRPSAKGMQKLSMSDRLQTDQQQAASRKS